MSSQTMSSRAGIAGAALWRGFALDHLGKHRSRKIVSLMISRVGNARPTTALLDRYDASPCHLSCRNRKRTNRSSKLLSGGRNLRNSWAVSSNWSVLGKPIPGRVNSKVLR